MYHLMTFLENHWSPKVRQMRVKSETSHFIKALFTQFSQVARFTILRWNRQLLVLHLHSLLIIED